MVPSKAIRLYFDLAYYRHFVVSLDLIQPNTGMEDLIYHVGYGYI